MGAEWVGLKHRRLKALCQQFHLKLIDHSLQTHLLYKGRYYRPSQWKFDAQWQVELKEKIKLFTQSSESQKQVLTASDWWHYLKSCHIPEKDLEIIDLIDSTTYGESIRFTSAFEALSELVLSGGTETDDYWIEGGIGTLPTALAEAIGHE